MSSFIIEFPVNVHHEVEALLKALLDEETDELEYEAAMRAILTFTSPSVTPGSDVHQRLLRVWLQADEVASSMIYATLVELYNFHRPGSHPSVWSPASPPKERRKFFSELLRLASVEDFDAKEQKNKNAETMLEYFLIILSRDEKRLSSSSLTRNLFTGNKLALELIEQAFVCLYADEGISLRVTVLFQLVALVLEEEFHASSEPHPGEALFLRKYKRLGEDAEQCFLSVFPAGETKLRLLDKITRKQVVEDEKDTKELKDTSPDLKKLCEYYFCCHPKKDCDLVVLMRLCAMTEIITTQKSDFSTEKVQSTCEAFVNARMDNLDRFDDKNEYQFLMKIQFLVQSYLLALSNQSS